MTALSDALERLQRCSGSDDRKWQEAWAGLIRAVERNKGSEDLEARVRERWLALFPKDELPQEEVA